MLKVSRRLDLDKHTAWFGHGVYQIGDENARYDRQPDREILPGDRPAGEARNIFDGGGRYFSLLGGNGLFHHPDDRWPDAVDVAAVAAFARAFTDIAVELTAA